MKICGFNSKQIKTAMTAETVSVCDLKILLAHFPKFPLEL